MRPVVAHRVHVPLAVWCLVTTERYLVVRGTVWWTHIGGQLP